MNIPAEALAASRSTARVVLQRVQADGETRNSLEAFLAAYDAVLKASRQHDAAVFVGAAEAKRFLKAKPVHRQYSYPVGAGDLIPEDTSPGILAGYFSFLSANAEIKAQRGATASVNIQDRVYVLHKPLEQSLLFGIDAEVNAMRKYVKQLFLYMPDKMNNPDLKRFPKTVLVYGPPGTGKTSLFKIAITEAKRLERVTGKRCSVEQFDASNFSSYFGKSSRIMKQKLQRVQDPSGVGMFFIEDADMVLQSRNDGNVYHGVLQVQQYLMNYLSGLQPYYGNTISFVSTNRPDKLDEAFFSRMQAKFMINPFSCVETHVAYIKNYFPQLDENSVEKLARVSHSRGLSGRDLESMTYSALEATTREPTDEELVRGGDGRYGAVTAELLETLIAGKR